MKKEAEQLQLLDCWYRQFNDRLLDFLYRGVRIRADAQDLAQETYLRMLRVKSPELIDSPRAYLYRVAIHVLDEWRTKERRAKQHSSDGLEDIAASTGLYDSPEQRELAVDLRRALQYLPASYSATLVLRWHYGMTYAEVAAHLDVTERQVKRYIVKGYAALRIRLEPTLGRASD
tara:strand:+ start:180 stop:704 length:525 start_codon:yes stop_codon:yes gene_type:complete